VGEVRDADQVAGLVEADQVAHPREGRDVGDRVLVGHDPGASGQPLVEHAQQPLRLRDVAVARALVFVVAPGEPVKETDLAEHRPDAAHLEHQPLDGLVAACRVARHEPSGLLGEVQQDRARLPQRQRLAAGSVGVDQRRDLVVRVQRQELRRELVVAVEADQVRLVGQAGLFQHGRGLHAVDLRTPSILTSVSNRIQ
jgi:hypothetical protein